MLALRELQRSFVATLFGESAEGVERLVDVTDRLDVYRNNLQVGFTNALAIGFPVIQRLVGEEYFQQLAWEYLHAHPSRAGNLHHIGAPFAGFLRQKFRDTEYAYFADVAELEWAREEVLVAADDVAIEPQSLRGIEPEHYAELRFTVHAAVRLVRSDYPIVAIWRMNQPDAPPDETVDLRSGGEHVVVTRTSEHIEFHRVPAGDFATLGALAAGFPLAEALEAALAADPGCDLSRTLHRFFRLKLLTGLTSSKDLP